MSILIALTSLFVFIAGMMGAKFYNESKHKSKVSRSAYSSFVGYVLGLGPLMYYVLSAIKDSVPLKVVFGTFFIICTLTWTMCAMILKDYKDAKMENTSNYKYITAVLVATLIMSLMFLFLATFAPVGFGGIGVAKKMGVMPGMMGGMPGMGKMVMPQMAQMAPRMMMPQMAQMAQMAQQAMPMVQQAMPMVQQAMQQPMVQQAMQPAMPMQQAVPFASPMKSGFGRRIHRVRPYRR